MSDLITAIVANLKEAETPTLLIVIGSIFLLLCFIGTFRNYFDLSDNHRKAAGIAGALVLTSGIVLSALPVSMEGGQKTESNQQGGSYAAAKSPESREIMIETLKSMKNGHCPEANLHPVLQQRCLGQKSSLVDMFSRAGSIKNVIFTGMTNNQYGLVEVYKIDFDNQSMEWFVNRGQDGRLTTLATSTW